MERCDSCGVPLRDENRGTEADGSAAATYCSTCYTKGAFTLPNDDPDAVREASIKAMTDQGVPPLAARKLTENMATLARWV